MLEITSNCINFSMVWHENFPTREVEKLHHFTKIV